MTDFFDRVKMLKDEWQIPVMVFLSLAAQLSLAIFRSWRKTARKGKSLDILLWFTCIVVADWAGKAALADMADKPNEELALWASFILLHLGGPDTITAYSVEDNEWLRQIIAFLIQSGVVVYILGSSWYSAEPIFSILTLFLVFSGVCKYLDRIFSLTGSSFKLFIDSFSKQFSEDTILRISSDTETRTKHLHESCYLYMMFSSLFLNKVVPCKTWNKSRDLVSKSPEAVKLVETELEFMYDVSYTKARMFCSGPGILIRVAMHPSSP